jgi:hypothetical protein
MMAACDRDWGNIVNSLVTVRIDERENEDGGWLATAASLGWLKRMRGGQDYQNDHSFERNAAR